MVHGRSVRGPETSQLVNDGARYAYASEKCDNFTEEEDEYY